MTRNSFAPLAFICLSTLLLTGCTSRTISTGARVEPGFIQPHSSTIAVAPFENLSLNRQAGLILSDLAATILYAQSDWQVREISGLSDDSSARLRRLEIDPWERQVGVNTASAIRIGRALDVDFVLAGSVGEYGFVDGFGETANVGVTLRLVDVGEGTVAWAGSLSRKVTTASFSDESVHRLAHQVLIDLLERMNTEIGAQ